MLKIDVEGDTTAEKRYWSDLIRNANSPEYCNERGFRQKLIENLYNSCYYELNESIFENSVKE